MTEPKKKHPLWLPEGSVRAIIALSVAGTAMYLAATQAPVEDWFAMAFTLVISVYFEGRRAGTPTEDKKVDDK